MKTAEQWSKEIREREFHDVAHIKAIQLDAWRQGMSDAADRVADYFAKHPATSTAILRQVITYARDSRSTP